MLSIIIPTCNRFDLLRLCLDAVSRHAPCGTEVIVVDDASPGDHVQKLVRHFPGVQHLRLTRRSGFAVAANSGIRHSRGDIVELLNDDTEVQPGWADAAIAWFDQSHVAAVAPLVLAWPDGKRIDSAGDRYYLGGVAGKRGHGQPLGPDFLRPTAVFGASASSAFYRRSALDEVGLFPESFGSYFEDVDLAFRLRRAGYTTMFDPGTRVLHRVSATFGRPGRALLQQQSCNEERVFWRNVPTSWLGRALVHHLAVLAGKAARRWQEGTLAPFLCGRLRLLLEIPELWRHRHLLARFHATDLSSWEVDLSYRAA